eukprot:jgi/Chlat1/7244/Chrsp58S06887
MTRNMKDITFLIRFGARLRTGFPAAAAEYGAGGGVSRLILRPVLPVADGEGAGRTQTFAASLFPPAPMEVEESQDSLQQALQQHQPPSTTSPQVAALQHPPVVFGACQRAIPLAAGGVAVDGCQRFDPETRDGGPGSMRCVACGCHRNFHLPVGAAAVDITTTHTTPPSLSGAHHAVDGSGDLQQDQNAVNGGRVMPSCAHLLHEPD